MKKIILDFEYLENISTPEIKITKSINNSTATASFIFKEKKIFDISYKNKLNFSKIKIKVYNYNLYSYKIKITFEQGIPIQLLIIFVFKNIFEWFLFKVFLKNFIIKHNLIFLN